MNFPSSTVAPLPNIPKEAPVPARHALPSPVRLAAMMLLFAGVFQIFRAGLYLMGDLPGGLSAGEIVLALRGSWELVPLWLMARGLLQARGWARLAALGGCPLGAWQMGEEIVYILGLRASGYLHTGPQLLNVTALFLLLCGAVICLLTRDARAAFNRQE